MLYKRNFNVYGYKIDFYQTAVGAYCYVNGTRIKSMMFTTTSYRYIDDEVTLKIKYNRKPPLFLSGVLDIYIDDKLITESVPLKFSFRGLKNHESQLKAEANADLDNFDIEEAIAKYDKAKEELPDDYDIDFRLACCYSVLEHKKKCIYHLSRFIRHAHEPEFRIQKEDKLAWYRMVRNKDI